MENEAVASQPRARKRYLDENPSHPPLHPVPLNFEALGGGGSNPNASAVQGNPSGTGSVSFFNTDMKMKAIKSRRMIGIDADFHKRSPVLAPINRDIRVPETHLGRSAQNTAQPCLPSLMRSPKGFQFPPQLDDEPKENFARPVARRLYQTSATTPKNSLPLFPHMLPLSGLGSNQRSNMDEIAQVPPIQKKQPKDASSFVSVTSPSFDSWPSTPFGSDQHVPHSFGTFLNHSPKNPTSKEKFLNSFLPGSIDPPSGMNNSNTGKQFGSSDEQKFSFEDEISYSQEMMQDLSVHGTKAAELRLEENFIKSLNEREKEAMKKLGIFTISLSVHQKHIILGRDQFKVVFGDKIGGHDISILSRKHCIFHISSDAASKMIVTVENTSTNGIEVNKRSIETGEPVRLHHGDVITLLRVHQGPKEVSLDYVLFDPDHSRSPVKKKSKALSRPSSSAPNELHHGLPLPPPTGERTPPKESQADLDLINPRIPRVTLQQRPTSAASSIFSNSSVTFLGGIVNLSVLVSDPIMRSSVQGSSIDFGSAFSGLLSTTRLKMEKSHATAELLDRSIKNDSNQVVLLSAPIEDTKLVLEDRNGFEIALDQTQVNEMITNANAPQKLIILHSNSIKSTQFFESSFPVIFVNSNRAYHERVEIFLRALFAAFVRGFSMEKSFSIAENAATHDWIPIVKNFHRQEPVFKAYLTAVNEEDWTSISTSGLSWPLFFSSESVDVPTEVKIENPPNSGGDGDGGGALKEVSWKKIFPMVNRNLIPFLPPYFDGRKKELKKIFQNLRASATESNGWMRVCNIMGNQGIGKSSLAIAIASYSNSREWYPNGVHFISIETIMSEYLKSHPLQDEEEDHPQSISQQLEILKQTSSCTFKSEFNRNVLSYFQDMIEETLVSSSTKEQLEPSTLLILDGCDYFIPVTLRDLLLRILQQYPGVQIITTSRQEMKININSKLVEEMTMALHALDKVSAAQLLLNLSPRRLSYAELKKSDYYDEMNIVEDSQNSQNDQNDVQQEKQRLLLPVLERHPALTRLQGNPMLISALAYELHEKPMDELD